MRLARSNQVAALAAAALLLAGCAAPAEAEGPARGVGSPAPKPPAPTSTPTPEAIPDEMQLRLELLAAAERSCIRQIADGLTMANPADGTRLVLMGDGKDYQGYSAFAETPSGEVELVFEVDLTPCTIAWTLASGDTDRESGYGLTIGAVTGGNGSYQFDGVWDGGDFSFTVRYDVSADAEPVIIAETILREEGDRRTEFTYSTTAADADLLAAAVESVNQ